MIRRAGLVLLGAALALVVGELVARGLWGGVRSEPLARSLRWERVDGERRPRRYDFVEPDLRVGYLLRPGRHETRFADRTVVVDVDEGHARRAGDTGRTGRPLVALGCSFTFGFGVAGEQAWPARLGAALGRPVVNLGVPGYGQDQAALLYEAEGRARRPSLVVLGLVPFTEARNLADVSPFAGTAFPKPRFVLDGEGLALRGVPDEAGFDPWAVDAHGRRLGPLERWGLRSALLDAALRPDAEQARRRYAGLVETTVRIVGRIAAQARAGGARFLVVFLPTRAMLAEQGARAGHAFVPLQELLARGLACVNVASALARAPGPLFLEDGQHPAPAYHEVVAGELAAALEVR